MDTASYIVLSYILLNRPQNEAQADVMDHNMTNTGDIDEIVQLGR